MGAGGKCIHFLVAEELRIEEEDGGEEEEEGRSGFGMAGGCSGCCRVRGLHTDVICLVAGEGGGVW